MKNLIAHIVFILILASSALGFSAQEPDTVKVYVLGTHDDSRFQPATVEVNTGSVIKFMVKQGMHTVTAYHPDNRRELGIPADAESFDSGMLVVGDAWYLTVKIDGEYNYFCLPHERMGHKGKIIARQEQHNASSTKSVTQQKRINQ